jgi:hypothetical protein
VRIDLTAVVNEKSVREHTRSSNLH